MDSFLAFSESAVIDFNHNDLCIHEINRLSCFAFNKCIMTYYILGGTLILLNLTLLTWATMDIIKNKKNRGLIFLLLLTPYVGPIIYFQIK